MSYLHIENLYKNSTILLFREVFSLEKIHGTSSHVRWSPEQGVGFFSGGGKHETFCGLFDAATLNERFAALIGKYVVVYGEFYGGGGGQGQGMSATYGKEPRFAAFDVKVGDVWLSVPQMAEVCGKLGLEVVHWEKIEATVEAINAARDADSVQAIRNGVGPGRRREGVVLRPLMEMTTNNGERVIAKHKRAEFSERSNEPKVVDPARLQVLADANAIADEWVVPMRLDHVLQKLDPPAESMRDTGRVVSAMIEDVQREAAGEIVPSREATTAIGRKAAALFHERIRPST